MKKTKKIFLTLLIIFSVITILAIGSFMIYFYTVKNSVIFSKENLIYMNSQIKMYDSNNEEIAPLNATNKNIVPLSSIPKLTQNAFISIEDKSFYKHHGLNYKRIAKAMLNNIKQGAFVEGASTISQQLIKNTHLTNEKTIDRKLKEMILTKKLEEQFTKDEILEMYLNVIYFGENSYGISKASQTYFGKDVEDLTLSESALLAGMIKSPATYSPRYHYEESIARRDVVLQEMLEDGHITKEQYTQAKQETVMIATDQHSEQYANLYYRATLQEASQLLGKTEKEIAVGGYQIYTYYHDALQKNLAEKISSEDYDIQNTYGNIADGLGIIIDNHTAGVVAYAGKSTYDLVNFKRQPGSAIKPILIYSPALEEGIITPDSLILDENITIDGYTPHNLGNVEHGYVTTKYSVAKSLNVPAVKIMQRIGIEKCKNYAEKTGITFDALDQGYAIALGGFTTGVTLKDLTNAYIPYTNQGNYTKSHFIRSIRSSAGVLLYENKESPIPVFSEDTSYLMTDMLIEGVKTGTSKRLSTLDFDIAGKTGTVAIPHTNDNSDAISIAYTSDLIMGVWYGNYSNQKEYILPHNNNGGTMATQLIADTFKEHYKDEKPEPFSIPDSVQSVKIDRVAYDNNQQLWKAPSYMPDRYTKEILVGASSQHLILDQDYLHTCLTSLSINHQNHATNITFDAIQNFDYEIHRISPSGEDKIIEKYQDKNEPIHFVDYHLDYNQKYTYYIVVKCGDQIIKTSSPTTIKTAKKEKVLDSLLQKETTVDDISFLFQ